MKGLSLEVRVGLLILLALGILGGFTFVLSGVQFGDTYAVFADFDNPGSVMPGAPVKVGGIKVGSVEGLTYLGGKLDPKTGRRALVRLELHIERRVQQTIHDNALFYVTSQGVLGEQFVAIDPGSYDKPTLREGSIMHGVDPPRLDLALALGYELLETLVDGIRNNREELSSLLTNIGDTLRALRDLLVENRSRFDNIIVNVESATRDAAELVRATKGRVDGPEVQRILSNLDRSTSAISRDIGPLLSEVRGATGKADDILSTIGEPERARIQETIATLATLADRANRTVGDTQDIVANIKRGEGTVGALVADEEMYDDLQEMIRDLKHNPWKFFWRE